MVRYTAKGTGFPPANIAIAAQRERMAILAATLDAKRNLLALVVGDFMEVLSVTESNIVAGDTITDTVTGLLRNVVITSATYDDTTRVAEVTVELITPDVAAKP